MKVIYSDQPYDSLETNSIFLAGPTPRSNDVPSWRPEALDILKKMDFTGTVLVPEFSNGNHQINYTDQIEWEFKGLSQCGAIVFWVPRNMDTLPGMTTNVEFGLMLGLNYRKIFYGRPNNTPHTAYLDWWYNTLLLKPPSLNLESLLDEVLKSERKFQIKNYF